MFSTPEYYLPYEIEYRRERLTGDWRPVRKRQHGRRRFLRLPKRPTLRLPEQRPSGLTAT